MTTARIEKLEAEARKLLSEGFATKAAQGRAREKASRAYDEAKELFRCEGSYEVMCNVPYETNNYRAKHSDLILKAFPQFAAEVAVLERTVALYQEIKAAPVAPKAPARKLNDAGQLAMRSDAYNPVLRAEFMKRAPEIKANYIAELRSVAKMLADKFGDTIPAYIGDKYGRAMHADHGFFKDHADWIKTGRNDYKLVLNEETLERKATIYGEMVALQWFYKTNAKLGELKGASLIRESHGDVIVAGTKADGSKVSMNQQRILKRGQVSGGLFNQFPSYLYVDGKFHTAIDYAKRFKDASADE